jgi:hypothetical protein
MEKIPENRSNNFIALSVTSAPSVVKPFFVAASVSEQIPTHRTPIPHRDRRTGTRHSARRPPSSNWHSSLPCRNFPPAPRRRSSTTNRLCRCWIPREPPTAHPVSTGIIQFSRRSMWWGPRGGEITEKIPISPRAAAYDHRLRPVPPTRSGTAMANSETGRDALLRVRGQAAACPSQDRKNFRDPFRCFRGQTLLCSRKRERADSTSHPTSNYELPSVNPSSGLLIESPGFCITCRYFSVVDK